MTPEEYRRRLRALSTASATAALALWFSLNENEQAEAVAASIDAHRNQGVALADVFTASLLGTVALGLTEPDQRPRLVDALATIVLTGPDDVGGRLGRLATAEPLAGAQDATQTALERRGVTRVRRQTDSDPCPLCRKLAGFGPRPAKWKFARHPGCSCIPVPA